MRLLADVVAVGAPNAVVERFSDATSALAVCASSSCDLVIVDLMLPCMNGVDFVRRFRGISERSSVPVMMVTAISDVLTRMAALEAGVTDFVEKPFRFQEVALRIRNLLAMRGVVMDERAGRMMSDEAAAAAMSEVFARERELVVRLAKAAEFRDPETGAHVLRMAHYSRIAAERLGLSPSVCGMIFDAAPMHDVGKLGIPDEILLKPGRLSPEEFSVMRRHPQIGFSILSESRSELISYGAEIALTHHEKFDGTGYPRGLAGEEIPLSGRVVAVADVFDALTSDRPYKARWEPDRAGDFLRAGRGTHFDADCVDAMLSGWEEILCVMASFADEAVPESSVIEQSVA
jgi:putative two-component system response regulator